MSETEFHGHITMSDGSHIPLTAADATRLWDKIRNAHKERAEKMPDDAAALRVMQDGFQRLRDLGWREAIYCPKDGSVFEVIEAGSTGIFDCHYDGEWPNGKWWVHDNGDLWPSRPILFRMKVATVP